MKIRIMLIVLVFSTAQKMYSHISDDGVTNTLLSAYSEKAYSSEMQFQAIY
jgi:hypothetical protein